MKDRKTIVVDEPPKVKDRLREIVKTYTELFPDEYRAVVEIVGQKRKNMKDKFASIKGKEAGATDGALERAMFEISETLSTIIYRQLSPEEMLWHTSAAGAQWFQKTFKEFSLAESV